MTDLHALRCACKPPYAEIRLKTVVTILTSNVDKLTDETEHPVYLCNYIDVYKHDVITGAINFMRASATWAQIKRFSLCAGDVIITKDSETPHDIAIPAYVDSSAAGAICGYHLAILRPQPARLFGKYLFWVLRSGLVAADFSARAQGITRFGLTISAIGDVRVPLPNLMEQTATAAFLDRETAKIDALIAKQTEFLARLDEHRRAIIIEAVTRGLDRSVRTRQTDAGLTLPASWPMMPLKRLAISWCDGPFGSGLKSEHYADQGIRVIRLQNIGNAEFQDNNRAFVTEEYFGSLAGHDVQEGDLLIAGLGDDGHPVGRACVYPKLGPAMVKADCFRVRLRPDTAVAEFVALYLSSDASSASIALATRGATRDRINLSGAVALSIPLPPLDEQKQIVAHLRQIERRMANLIDKASAMIALLRERRAALITAAITGQIDVTPALTEAA